MTAWRRWKAGKSVFETKRVQILPSIASISFGGSPHNSTVPLVDDRHVGAQVGDVGHDMGRQQHRLVVADVGQQIVEAHAFLRVEAGSGFVDDDQFRVCPIKPERCRSAGACRRKIRPAADGALRTDWFVAAGRRPLRGAAPYCSDLSARRNDRAVRRPSLSDRRRSPAAGSRADGGSRPSRRVRRGRRRTPSRRHIPARWPGCASGVDLPAPLGPSKPNIPAGMLRADLVERDHAVGVSLGQISNA